MTSGIPRGMRTADLSDAEGDRLRPSSLPWRSEQGTAVTFGGVTIRPGSRVFADEDGVLVEVAGP